MDSPDFDRLVTTYLVTLSQQWGGPIMHNTLLRAPMDFQALLRPCTQRGALLRGAKLIWSPEIFFFTLSKGFGKPNQKTQSDLAWFRQIIRRRVESGYAFIRPSTTQKHECLAGPVENIGTVGIFPNQILQRRWFFWYLYWGKKCAKMCFVIVLPLSYDIDCFEVTGPNQI